MEGGRKKGEGRKRGGGRKEGREGGREEEEIKEDSIK